LKVALVLKEDKDPKVRPKKKVKLLKVRLLKANLPMDKHLKVKINSKLIKLLTMAKPKKSSKTTKLLTEVMKASRLKMVNLRTDKPKMDSSNRKSRLRKLKRLT